MFYNLKESSVKIGDTHMDYAVFGKGKTPLVMIPGLSLRDVKGAGWGLAIGYSIFAKDYRVYVFDKKADVPDGYSVKDIADDTVTAMRALGIERAHIFGTSLGGMVAQYIAVYYPEIVDKLILAVTTARNNEVVSTVVGGWIDCAERGDLSFIANEMLGQLYSEELARKYGKIMPLIAKFYIPKDMPRFIRMARACLTVDILDRLCQIKAPTLVLGGERDKIVGGFASYEIAERIPDARIYMYEKYGHSAYDEAPDFNKRILDFISQ